MAVFTDSKEDLAKVMGREHVVYHGPDAQQVQPQWAGFAGGIARSGSRVASLIANARLRRCSPTTLHESVRFNK
jgi:hypothetical protein